MVLCEGQVVSGQYCMGVKHGTREQHRLGRLNVGEINALIDHEG